MNNNNSDFLKDNDSAILNITVLGTEIDFYYPNNVFMKNIVLGVFKGNDYPLPKLQNYTAKTIIDIGANIGTTAIYFLSYFPHSKVYCYEPSLRNFRYLKENTKYFDNIESFPYGLFNKSSNVQLYYGKSQSAQDSIIPSAETVEGGEVVQLLNVAEEVEKKGFTDISIIKIDTEGCELPILTEFLKLKDLNIDILYIEYHSEDDRLTIDHLLSERFLLFYSKTNSIHRGNNGYLSKSLCQKHPDVEWLKK